MAPSAEKTALVAPAEPARGRGRPKGCCFKNREQTIKFSVQEGVEALAEIAANTYHPGWVWSGMSYPTLKWGNSPNMDFLNRHRPLEKLIALAPNGRPDPWRLRDLLVSLHDIYGIFNKREESEVHLPLSGVAKLAAGRWQKMCRHIALLRRTCRHIPRDLVLLKKVVSLVNLGGPAEPAPAPEDASAATSPA